MRRFAAVVLVGGICAACAHQDLRGSSKRSVDGKTYLVIDDDNGGQCGSLLVDAKPWPHAVHAPGPVAPGLHQVACGSQSNSLSFRVDSGRTYHFDYWGP